MIGERLEELDLDKNQQLQDKNSLNESNVEV